MLKELSGSCYGYCGNELCPNKQASYLITISGSWAFDRSATYCKFCGAQIDYEPATAKYEELKTVVNTQKKESEWQKIQSLEAEVERLKKENREFKKKQKEKSAIWKEVLKK